MAGLERVADGMRLRLDASEVAVVASLADGLVARLADPSSLADDILERLAPPVSRGDAAVDEDLRGMLRDDLLGARAGRLDDLATFLRSGDADGFDRVLDRDAAMRTLEALNDLRVALAATVGYEVVAERDVDPEDPRVDALRLLDALAWLQGGLIDYVDED